MLSSTEENYLKALLKLTFESETNEAGTNDLASLLALKPATVNDMLKRLKEKQLVTYEKYGKISLTNEGRKNALEILRKHRLWETFLHDKLKFTWDEVHDVAEQLEHIQSIKLIDKLDDFLGYPKFDPHGEPIPDSKGDMKQNSINNLAEVTAGNTCRMVSVKDNSSSFLQYVDKVGLAINSQIRVLSKQEYDALMVIEVNGITSTVSQKFAENIYVDI